MLGMPRAEQARAEMQIIMQPSQGIGPSQLASWKGGGCTKHTHQMHHPQLSLKAPMHAKHTRTLRLASWKGGGCTSLAAKSHTRTEASSETVTANLRRGQNSPLQQAAGQAERKPGAAYRHQLGVCNRHDDGTKRCIVAWIAGASWVLGTEGTATAAHSCSSRSHHGGV